MLAPMGPESTASATPAILDFEAVSFLVTGGPKILDGVSLGVPAGLVTVVTGPSGAGKSTLLRLGNRLEVPTTGVVRFRGADLASVDPRTLRRNVGMVFQRPVPFAGSVRANLAVADPKSTDEQMSVVLDRVGLDASFLDRVADDLSGGEAQRMCIARTLLTTPDVILMDEPTASLDPENRLGIEALARELATEGIGVVWITHDLDQVDRIADRAFVLIDGRNASGDETAAYLTRGMSEDES